MATQNPPPGGPAPGFGTGTRRDFAHLLDEAPWSAYQKMMLALLAMVFAVDGLANQSLGIAVPALIEDWGVPADAFSLVTAANLTGVALGSVLGGLLGDKIGRRTALIAAVLLFGAMTAAGALATSPATLTGIRFIDGLGIGAAIPNGAALIAEITPRNKRGRAIAIGMVFIPFGGILAGAIGATVLEAFGWKTVMLLAGGLPILLALLFIFALPESPSFLLRSGRSEALERLLTRCGIALTPGEQFAEEECDRGLTAPFRVLLADGVRRNTFLMWTGFFTCLMASYTIFSWVPTMLRTLDFSLTMTSLGITTFHGGGMVGALFSGWLIDKRGFRQTHLALALIGTVLASTLAIMLGADLIAAMVILPIMMALGFCMAGLHNTLYTLAATSYPTSRATGVGVASAVGRIGAVLSSFTGVQSLNMGGSFGFFGVIAVLTLICGIAGWMVHASYARSHRESALA